MFWGAVLFQDICRNKVVSNEFVCVIIFNIQIIIAPTFFIINNRDSTKSNPSLTGSGEKDWLKRSNRAICKRAKNTIEWFSLWKIVLFKRMKYLSYGKLSIQCKSLLKDYPRHDKCAQGYTYLYLKHSKVKFIRQATTGAPMYTSENFRQNPSLLIGWPLIKTGYLSNKIVPIVYTCSLVIFSKNNRIWWPPILTAAISGMHWLHRVAYIVHSPKISHQVL